MDVHLCVFAFYFLHINFFECIFDAFFSSSLKLNFETGDVELKNMQLKPEALNALKLPVKVKAGFLGSVKLKVGGALTSFLEI
jgi:hypothetical protein